jgi:hypothetical protein
VVAFGQRLAFALRSDPMTFEKGFISDRTALQREEFSRWFAGN